MILRNAAEEDFSLISKIAYATWPHTYGNILSESQLEYMLALFYSVDALTANLQNGHQFFLAFDDNVAKGFISCEHGYNKRNRSHIHKIYILPEFQGNGIGTLLLQHVVEKAMSKGSDVVSLNVNRNNPAVDFYSKLGFEIEHSVDIELDHGYLMEDFVMVKYLRDF